ncbi:bacteriohemerythrin [Bdellovibrio svalbardensis]|uniref:Bacteriohemerythrin n=1 Tax=Bdellovibrio svalbardensis TaxID=2972972 RepID=A0ABT6DMQ9_9BACT|nr:bacteriohemerythrin [Bdellovibrio svalbardensis]MDG0818156.1 bacteriohemerythrin [Bdellovibrio svalbardensis]
MSDVYFKWDAAKLSTQVEAMDDEHMILINIMNQLYERHQAEASNEELLLIVKELVLWTGIHCEHEESYFATLPYLQADAHKKVHRDLLDRLKQYHDNFEKTGALDPMFFQFLKTWLTAHIMGIDSKYGEIAVRVLCLAK